MRHITSAFAFAAFTLSGPVAPAGVPASIYTLELFHLADQEAAAAAVGDAPRLSAILNKLRDEDLGGDGLPDNTLTLSSGDAFIPGLFFDASEAVYGTAGIADIQIQNELGIQAISLGNHEFDFDTPFLASLIDGSAAGSILGSDFTGTDFPYLSGNLDFSTDPALAPLVTADHQAPLANTLAATTVINVNGELIGVVSATTPTLASISSPGTVGIAPFPFDPNPTPVQLDALAAGIQADVDGLLLAHPTINKVILLSHMQRLDIEQAIATRLTDVDIIVGGGSNTRLFDANDRIRAGDNKQGDYPIFLQDANTEPVAVVNTDGSYKYLGRLVIDFDPAGNIVPGSYDPVVSGAYATDAQGVTDLAASSFTDPEIQQIADEIEAEIIATDGNFFGLTSVFLNGNRSGGPTDGVRTQETNLGNLTADANLAAARAADPTVVMSLKNGGGIRASIGETVVLPGATEASRIPPTANPLSGRPAGGISENAIKTSLAFNNGLTLLTVTKAELVALLEHGVGAVPSVSGRFPQIAGVKIAVDESAPSGDRILSAALVDDLGNVTQALVRNGELVGDPDEQFRIVTLSFLAANRFADGSGTFTGGGDGYPFPNINNDPGVGEVAPAGQAARVDTVQLTAGGTSTSTGTATFAPDGSEQDALAEFLAANFSSVPFAQSDLPRAQDCRIQFVGDRTDVVFQDALDNGAVLSLLSQFTMSAGAEIGAFDPVSGRFFVTSGAGVQIVDYSDPSAPVEIALITPLSDGADTNDITSTATSPTEDIVAIAVVGAPKTDPGQVAFYQASTGSFLGLVEVGALPDQILFTPDGSNLLVCNEGQSADPDENDPLIFPNPEGSLGIITMPGAGAAPTQGAVATADFNAFDSQADSLRAAGVRLFPNVTAAETAVDADTDLTVSQDLEPEAVATNAAGTTAWVTLQENNAVAEVDIASATVTAIIPLGLKDHSDPKNKLDASNRDSGINIRNWPVWGMYMPDQIQTFETGGMTYLLTANEGDGRDVDETRIGDLTLDPSAFPAAAALQDDANLGRLKASNINGDLDGDGDFDQLFSFGARSFTIWDAATGAVVFDSGDQFERITAQLLPAIFNSDEGDPAEFDSRSDDKGPEPEGLTIGSFNGRTYCFVGLERISAIMVYDITDPVNPVFVELKRVPGDAGPEGLVFLDGSSSPTGTPLLVVTNEDSNTLTTFSLELPYTLELFHIADQEGASAAIGDAPRLSAVLNKLRDEDLGGDGQPDNTLTLSSGDAFIPGLFFEASEAAFGSAGIADIQIQNELGIQAMALGNHEFDLGTEVLADLIDGSAPGDFTNTFLDGTALDDLDFAGTTFPYLSTNLDFSTDTETAPLAIAGGQAPQANVLTSSTLIDVNGETVAVIGATTPTLASISSPGSVGIAPSPFAPTPSPTELDALAAEIQSEVDSLLTGTSINKVILLAHMQQIDIEEALATRLSGVDVIVAGGSNTRLFDSDDRIRSGDSFQGAYPTLRTDADGRPVAVVNTDGSYKYLGRLVLDFDAAGNIIPTSYDETVSGAYATDAQGVTDLGAAGFVDPEIQAMVDALEAEIIATEGNVFGVANVFLNGNRSGTSTADDPDGVRTQETNLGDLTADANLVAAQAADPTVVISIKNGGGIRASIGRTLVPAGGTEAVRLPNEEVLDSGGAVIKPEGGISQNDIATTLAFNNGLILLTVTKQELIDILEHGVDALPGVSGRFPQVAGLKFSFDETQTSGSKLSDVVLTDASGNITQILMDDGVMLGSPTEEFRLVTLDFLAAPRFDAPGGNFIGAGDGYPFPNFNTDPLAGEVGPDAARINATPLEQSGVQTGAATFADDGTEQDAFAEYLFANHPTAGTAYAQADVGPAGDLRIQNLGFRSDSVLLGVDLNTFASAYGVNPTEDDVLLAYAFGLDPTGVAGELVVDGSGNVVSRGTQAFSIELAPNEVDLSLTFLRRKDAGAQGLTYTGEYSSDMITWFTAPAVPEVIGMDGEMEVVRLTLPFFTPTLEKSRFFRIRVAN